MNVSRINSMQVGAATGAVGALVYVASAFTTGKPLRPDVSTTQVVQRLSAHQRGEMASFLLAIVAFALILWFLGYLRALLAEAEEDHSPLATITTVSWIALMIIVVAGTIPLVAVDWLGAGKIYSGNVQLAFAVSNLSLYSLSATAALVAVLAPVVVIWRTGVLPRWLVLIGAVEIAVNLVELAGLFSRSGQDAGGYAGGVGPFVWAFWIWALSIAMVMRGSTPEDLDKVEEPDRVEDPDKAELVPADSTSEPA